MLAVVLGHVDLLDAGFGKAEGRLAHLVGVADDGEDAAVVVFVGGVVHQRDARHAAHRVGDVLDDLFVSALGAVWNAFDNSCHRK